MKDHDDGQYQDTPIPLTIKEMRNFKLMLANGVGLYTKGIETIHWGSVMWYFMLEKLQREIDDIATLQNLIGKRFSRVESEQWIAMSMGLIAIKKLIGENWQDFLNLDREASVNSDTPSPLNNKNSQNEISEGGSIL